MSITILGIDPGTRRFSNRDFVQPRLPKFDERFETIDQAAFRRTRFQLSEP